MKMSTNKCLSIWQSLKPEPPQSIFKRFDATHPLDFYLGLDGEGRHLLLFVCSEEPPHLMDMRTITLKKSLRDDGRWALLWILEDFVLLEMFSLLSEDLIEHSRNIDGRISPLNFVLRRLSSWRSLLDRASDNILSMTSIRGLCGELVFLDQLIDQLGGNQAVMSWVGPFGADQDFQFGSAGWEVKTIRPDAERLMISSERQLDSADKNIQLMVVEIADVSSSSDGMFTLNIQVSKLRKKLSSCYEALLEFDNRLLIAGYVAREEYGSVFFKIRGLASFTIAEGFPHVSREMVPAGVVNICYEIELKELESFLIERVAY
ncbi:Putative PD-(D/E)XK family member [Pseudomonas sp. NFIX49]|nr:Putative PD-(D/E)XK family member [Pseudomonas sp. NFIX46]SDB15431.1 Putative PD-(D/E)XK family member [Pseudomonas putida]SFQ63370.1 Putative PD-(D/E)XK family member [Pseudomonas sp. NFIX49]